MLTAAYSATSGCVLEHHTQETVDISLFSTQELYPKELKATALVSASNFAKRGQHLYSLEMFSCKDKTFPAAVASVTQAPWGDSTFKPLNSAWGKSGSAFSNIRAVLPQIRVDTLIGSQANYEIKIKITIYVYKIMIAYEKYSTLNLY